MGESTTIALDLAKTVPIRRWALAASTRLVHKRATVALAHKLARDAWAVATHEVPFPTKARAA